MASTNQTTNYGLPLYSQSDKASWVDTNEGFSALDTDLHTAKTTAESASGQATTNAENITDLQGRMSSAEGSLTTLTNTTIPAMQAEIDLAETATGTSYSNADSGLTSSTVQGAIDEVAAKQKSKVLATISGNGTLTHQDALYTFYDTIADLPLEERLKLKIRIKYGAANAIQVLHVVYTDTRPDDTTLTTFAAPGGAISSDNVGITTIVINTLQNTVHYTGTITAAQTSIASYTSTVLPTTTTFELVI